MSRRILGCRLSSFGMLVLFVVSMLAQGQELAPAAGAAAAPQAVPPVVQWMISEGGGPVFVVWLAYRMVGLLDRSVTLAEDVWRAHRAGLLRPFLVDLRSATPDPSFPLPTPPQATPQA